MLISKKLVQTVINQILDEDNSANKRLMLFILIRQVLESLKTIDSSIARAILHLLEVY